MTPEIPSIPEALLAPLLDEAAGTLHSLAPHELPPSLRSLAGFDARGLARGAARRQLQRAFDEHEGFRERVVERFLARHEAARVRDEWDVADAQRIVRDSMSATSLSMLASVLYAARPPGWAFGLGAACEACANEGRVRELGDEMLAHAGEHAGALEAQRRAEAARTEVELARARAERELRDERRARRERERSTEHEQKEAKRAAAALEDAIARARAGEEEARARASREAERARGLERELAALAHVAPPAPPADPAPLRAAAAEARALAARLEGLAEDLAAADLVAEARGNPTGGPSGRAGRGGPQSGEPGAGPRPRPRRARASCPPGLIADTPAGLDAMLRSRGVVVVVDGYNVSKTAWGSATLEEQRERLLSALAELHLRIRCDVVVAFDGDGVRGVPPLRRPGVRVVFSAPGEEADDVVVREAAAPPGTVPVVVVSSDADVRRRAEVEGAATVAAPVLLAVLRR